MLVIAAVQLTLLLLAQFDAQVDVTIGALDAFRKARDVYDRTIAEDPFKGA